MDDLPVWVVVMFSLVLAVGVIAVLVFLGQREEFARLPTTRLYKAAPDSVATAAAAAIQQLGYSIVHREEQSISYSPGLVTSEMVATFPVVHFVILPTDEGNAQCEVVGARTPHDYFWNSMALPLLKELDEKFAQA